VSFIVDKLFYGIESTFIVPSFVWSAGQNRRWHGIPPPARADAHQCGVLFSVWLSFRSAAEESALFWL